MASDDIDRGEIDHLIRELSSPPPKPARPVTPAQPAAPAPAKAEASPSPEPARRQVSELPRLPPTVRRALGARVAADAIPRVDRATMVSMYWSQISAPIHGVFDRIQFGSLPRFRDILASPGPLLTVWMWVGLGLALAVAMPFWPYPKACSWWLLFYFFAVVLLITTGIWAARITWITRTGFAHALALCIVLWGITLGASETLPRVGYAKTEASFFCPW